MKKFVLDIQRKIWLLNKFIFDRYLLQGLLVLTRPTIFSLAKQNHKYSRYNPESRHCFIANSMLFENLFWKLRYLNCFSNYFQIKNESPCFLRWFCVYTFAIFISPGSRLSQRLYSSFRVKFVQLLFTSYHPWHWVCSIVLRRICQDYVFVLLKQLFSFVSSISIIWNT